VEHTDVRKQWNENAMAWTALTRGGYDVYRDLVNTPAFLAMLPPIEGLLCLDLGCGEGHNTRMLANRGARVVGVDISDSLIEAAIATCQQGICYALGNGEDLPFGDATFDVVTGFMSFMDSSDPERVLGEATRVLRQDGVLQFSITHPSTSPPGRRWVNNEAGEREALAIGGYFSQGPFTESWIFGAAPPDVKGRHPPFTITSVHWTLSRWLNAVLAAGLAIEEVAEPCADEETAALHPEVADTRIAPYFLILRARRT
jgi:SAM-dependent methyltransferase